MQLGPNTPFWVLIQCVRYCNPIATEVTRLSYVNPLMHICYTK